MPNALQDPPKTAELEQEWEEWYGGVTKLVRVWQVSLDPSNVGATAGADDTVTVSGLSTQDAITVHSQTALTDGLIMQNYYCSAKDTLTIQWYNPTAGAINMGSISLRIIAVKTIT